MSAEHTDPLTLAEWIDQVADAFENAWIHGPPPQIADYLGTATAERRAVLLRELVKIDLEYRWKSGEHRNLEDYLTEFPELLGPDGALPNDLVLCASLLRTRLHGLAKPAPNAAAGWASSAEDLPKTFARFQLLRLLGQGSLGFVYQARDAQLGRTVAIKIPRAGAFATSQEQERFLREARSAAHLKHPHIVAVHEIAQENGVPYLVREYIEGQTLADLLRQRRPAFRAAAEWVVPVADALDYAHRRGVIHRDINARNILVDSSGRPHVTDFGLALRRGAESTMTADGQVLGTPAYMSPEQAVGHSHQVDGRSDVYSLGVVLYELLTGERPFRGSTHMLVHQVTHEEPQPPRKLDPQIPRDLETICLKAMAKSPTRRYATAGKMADDLGRYLRGEPIHARPVGKLEQLWRWGQRNPGVASLVLLVATLLLGVAVSTTWAAIAALGRERNRQRELLVQQLQLQRIPPRMKGWFDDSWRLIAEAARLRKDGLLRHQAAATLAGMDARREKLFENQDASSVAFDPKGKRLFMGGTRPRDGRPSEGAKLWDSVTNQLQVSQQVGEGPVAFRADDTPLQLVPQPGPSLLLWDVAQQQRAKELAFAAKPDQPKASALARNALGFAVTAMTSDGAWVAAAAITEAKGKSIVAVWEAASGKLLLQNVADASALALSPTGSHLAAADSDGWISIWSIVDGQRLTNFQSTRTTIHCLAFSPDCRRLAVGDAGGTVTIWDWLERISLPCFGSRFDVYAVAFSPDGSILASGGRGLSKLWDTATGRLLLDIDDSDFVTGLAFSADGRKLAVSGVSGFVPGRVLVWELESGRGIQTLRGLASQVSRVCFAPDGRLLAALAQNWQVALWDLATGQLHYVLNAPKGLTADNAGLAFSHDSSLLAIAAGQEARLWDVATGQVLRSWELPPGLCDRLAFHPSGPLLLFRVETQDGKLGPHGDAHYRDHPRVCRIRDLRAPNPRKPIFEITEFNGPFPGAVAAADGSVFVVTGTHDGPDGQGQTVRAFDGLSGAELWSPLPLTKSSLWLDPTGRVVAIGPHASEPPLLLVDVLTGKRLEILQECPNCLGPGASYLVVPEVWRRGRERNRGLALYRRGETTPLVILGIDNADSCNPEFSRDGSLLAWGDTDGSVLVCNLPQIWERLATVGLAW